MVKYLRHCLLHQKLSKQGAQGTLKEPKLAQNLPTAMHTNSPSLETPTPVRVPTPREDSPSVGRPTAWLRTLHTEAALYVSCWWPSHALLSVSAASVTQLATGSRGKRLIDRRQNVHCWAHATRGSSHHRSLCTQTSASHRTSRTSLAPSPPSVVKLLVCAVPLRRTRGDNKVTELTNEH